MVVRGGRSRASRGGRWDVSLLFVALHMHAVCVHVEPDLHPGAGLSDRLPSSRRAGNAVGQSRSHQTAAANSGRRVTRGPGPAMPGARVGTPPARGDNRDATRRR